MWYVKNKVKEKIMKIIKVPIKFYQDCKECGCKIPSILKITKKNYYIYSKRDEVMNDFISRACYYINIKDGLDRNFLNIVNSARFTLRALHKANILNKKEIELINS